ncbi:cation diffusion facilitator family transporter [Natronocella acetinitrilica]|uniref:Cation diffusion facilitator family transporter n=1 Tax=Natronocella acetinitrilica TaxID=414046 RepID=A0AAE3G619_9GAMM|nr:cation diffusion facilitator family transporter [Natronocella acetinitrilica]MCP1676486.1 cation diffusion facilitator family transporter [Natronocella acetinitrilica]
MQTATQNGQNNTASDWPAKRRVTLVGGVVNCFLSVGKIAAGIFGQSQALVADGVHSLSDLLSDGLVLFAARWGSKEADEDHPYGHARIETAATALIGALLLMIGGGFVYDSVMRLLNPDLLLHPGWLALIAAVASVGTKEALYHYTLKVAHDTRSPLIEANAWHHRSDALSSIVVVVGVTGAMLGAPWLDAVAAIVVALFLGRMGWRFIRQSIVELVDTGLADDELRELEQVIDAVPGVRRHQHLRTRRMGGQVVMDVHLMLDPDIRLSEANRIATQVQHALLGRIDAVSDVLVGIKPDNELADSPADALPPREVITEDLSRAWNEIEELPEQRTLTLHYKPSGVDIDILVRQSPGGGDVDTLMRRLEIASHHLLYVGRIRLLVVEGQGRGYGTDPHR